MPISVLLWKGQTPGKKMQFLTAALLLLGVVAYTQARLVMVPGGTNITGTGAVCLDPRGMPVRFLDNTQSFSIANCATLRPKGVLRAPVAAGVVTVGVTFRVQHAAVTADKIPEADMKALNTFPIPFEAGESKEFVVPANVLLELDAQLLTFTDCEEARFGVYLIMAVKKSTTAGIFYETFFTQDFAIKQCRDKDRAARVVIDAAFKANTDPAKPHLGVPVIAGDPGAADPSPYIQMTDIFSSLDASITDAMLPANIKPADMVRVKWPRGILVYITRRHVDQCDYKGAHVRVDDEVLAFYPMEEEFPMDHNHIVDFGRQVHFGEKGKCLMCGEVTVVVLYDFLGRDKPRAAGDCSGMSTARIDIMCQDLTGAPVVQPYTSSQLIPFFKDQGTSAWIRTCHAPDGIKVFQFGQAFDKTMARYLDPSNDYEMKGVARLKIVADILNADPAKCAMFAPLDKPVVEQKGLGAQLSGECREFLNGSLVDLSFYAPDFEEKMKAKCGDQADKLGMFRMKEKEKATREAIARNFCPEQGVRTRDFDNDEFSDRVAFDKANAVWRKTIHMAAMRKPGVMCEVDPDGDQCGYRAIAQLMSSGERFSANMDLYDDHLEEEEFKMNFDEAKIHFNTKYDMDTEFLRHCPKPDFYKPDEKVVPAVWKLSHEGPMRGYYNILAEKWCYMRVAVWHCPACLASRPKPCDPTTGHNCPMPALPCDPATDPNCAIPALPCDPATEPHCPGYVAPPI